MPVGNQPFSQNGESGCPDEVTVSLATGRWSLVSHGNSGSTGSANSFGQDAQNTKREASIA